MRYYLDASILVAAVVDIEPEHSACATLLKGTVPLVVRSHAFSEAFATLTGGRLAIQVPADIAIQLIEFNIVPRVQILDMNPADYLRAMRQAKARGVRGTGIHDYLHLATAKRFKATHLQTLNLRHFRHFHRAGDPEIVKPA
ncbi:MAG: PIN domain-containing protein [Verrucomicrobiaceae bacterium]|nr:PIN domain-containing protein [Verrucomicrobiaceae bacterium]